MNSVCIPEEVYFGLYNKIGRLTEENRELKHRNENQLNMIMDLRNDIRDLKKQKEDLCELVGKTKKDCEKLCAEYSALVSTNTQYVNEIRQLKRKLDVGCNTCPDMENTKKKNDELKELVDFKRTQIENQADTIHDLDKKIVELRAGAKDLQEQNQILKDKIASLKTTSQCDTCMSNANELSAEIHDLKRALKSAEDDILEYRKANYALRKQLESPCKSCNVFDSRLDDAEAALKDADAKIQSANDKAANAKKEAKQAKETAERYREENFILSRKVDQFKKLNDELIKELARGQNGDLIMKITRKGEFNESASSD